ncbi:hypothetical protein Bbelb_395840 [Branchiostoma belcheri]|nr:hypothetical protein Bbelb_395840 [Branchiostoma belcheri]
MERVQKRALRITSCGGRRTVPNLPTLKERRESAAVDLLKAMLDPDHPLHDLVPPERATATGRQLRNSNMKFSGEHSEEICDMKRNFMFAKVHKAGGTTVTCIFQRFGYEHNLTFVLPMNRKSDVGWPHLFKQEDFIPSADA